jgi:amino acid adenylation domain-containing protein
MIEMTDAATATAAGDDSWPVAADATPLTIAGATAQASDTIATRVARFAQQSPENLALVDGDLRVTYAMLDAEVSALARRIVALGAAPGGRVALLFHDKMAAVRSIVATARSGHAYVPLDPADPEERLRFMLADSAPLALLTDASLLDRSRALVPAGCVVLDVAARDDAGVERALPDVDGDSTAHLFYTSGSTGQAKGVRQTHRNQLFFVDTYQRTTGIGPGDRISLMYSLSFAAGIAGIYRGLALGGTLCAYDLKRDGIQGLALWLDRDRIAMLHTFPKVFRELAGPLPAQRVFPHLRIVHLGGESLFAGDVELFRRHTPPQCRLVHQLSASEIGTIASNVIDHATVIDAGGVVSVGRPIPGVRLEVRRDDGSLAPIGEAGEVVACSRHLSPGYWNRPDLDARAFGDDPQDAGGRCYRTGDLGRLDDDGRLHFLGRMGSRVKIRGYTIDLAEVDAALAAWPHATGVVAAAESDDADATAARIIAYVEPRTGAPRDAAAVKRFVAGKLPLHMLPAEVRFVAALPRTAGGKLDRRRLAEAERLPASAGAAAAPRDAMQAAVAHVFAQLLKIEGVGPDDDFFLLGGDSLMAAELQARIRETFGVHVDHLHRDATVAAVAAGIRQSLARSPARTRAMPLLVPLWQHGRATPLFMVHGRHGQAYVSPHFMKLLGDDQPVWVSQARGLDGTSEPHATIEAMVDDYVAEVRKVRPHGPYFLGGLCVGGFIAAAMARALADAGETVLPLLMLDPPIRVRGRTEAHADPAHVAGKMRARHAAGKLSGPMDDPQYLEASVRTAAAFNDAVARYTPTPYAGDVYVLSSRHRMQLTDPMDLRAVFTGRVKRYEVGNAHGDALDPRNPVFASTLKRCIGLIHEAAPVA